jgi:hypothetical protein
MLATAFALALSSASPPPPTVAPSAVPRPTGQYGEYRTDLSRSRRWGRAGLAYFGAATSFGVVVYTQVVRDMGYRSCLAALREPDDDFLDAPLESLGCEIGIRGPVGSLGAMAAMPAMLGFVGAAGVALGRGDVDSGRVRSKESLRRAKIGGGAAIGAFGGALIVSNAILYAFLTGIEPSTQGLAVARARWIANDALLLGMAAGVGVVARARAYEKRRAKLAAKLGVAPMLGGASGISVAGTF